MDEQPADEWTFTYQRREVTVQARVVDTLLRHLGHAGVDVAEKIRAREESRCVRGQSVGSSGALCCSWTRVDIS